MKALVPATFRSGGLLRSVWQLGRHALGNYGWLRSMREGRCVNANGEPIPWLTYPAVDFLSQLDYSGKSVFEFGSGASTLFWGRRASRVVSIETDPVWYERVQRDAPPNCELVLSSADVSEYSGQIRTRGDFDVVVIDGPGESRPECCRRSVEHVKAGGMIVLDNSDLWLESAAILRRSDLIQADFTGFAPLQAHAHTTSVFFRRDYAFQPLDGRQPQKSVAQPAQPWAGY